MMDAVPVMDSTGLPGGEGVATGDGRGALSCVAADARRRDSLGDGGGCCSSGSSVHCSSGLGGLPASPLSRPGVVRCSWGLLLAGVGAVSTLRREKTDEAMLLSVMLWSRASTGVPLRLLGVTGRGSLDRELLERSW